MRALHASALCVFMIVIASCATIPVSVPGSPTGTGTTTPASGSVAADVIAYTNNERAKAGLAAFATSTKLMEAARIQAQQMAQYQRADHTITGATYPTLQSRLQAVGYAYWNAAENVAWNQQDARSVVVSWMSSSGHRANILNPHLTEIGAAMARSSRGEPYWIQVFGTPR